MRRYVMLFWPALSLLLGGLLTACGDSPTATPLPPTPDAGPRIEVTASATTLAIGDTLVLTGTAQNLGLPRVTLLLDGAPFATSDTPADTQGGLFTLVEAVRHRISGVFTLRAGVAGTTQVSMTASGQVSSKDPSGNPLFRPANAASNTLAITVTK